MKRITVLAALLLAPPALASDPSGLTAPQLDALRHGRGMGMSMPAEMNNHPGPVHMLEQAEALGLSPEQAWATEALTAGMKADAVALGEQVIAREGDLDALFVAGQPDEARLASLVTELGRLNAALRLVHLRAHVAATALLNATQVAAYYHARHRVRP